MREGKGVVFGVEIGVVVMKYGCVKSTMGPEACGLRHIRTYLPRPVFYGNHLTISPADIKSDGEFCRHNCFPCSYGIYTLFIHPVLS